MRSKKYLFIDGAYLRRQYTRFAQFWFGGEEAFDYDRLVRAQEVDKCFYYDCSDDKPRAGESQNDFDERSELQKRNFKIINGVPRAHVRYGTLKGASNKNPKRQKEVDILIAVDMMTHAARKNMDEAILVAGDMDFTPVVESLVDLGLMVTVVADKQTVADELRWAADFFQEITPELYHGWSSKLLQRKFPLPEVVTNNTRPQATVLKKGHLGDYECILYPANPKMIIYVEGSQDGQSEWVTFEDEKRLEKFCEKKYGPLNWTWFRDTQ